MGICIRISGPPQPINITIPGGAKITSQPSSTQSVPNHCDPIGSLFTMAAPAFGVIQPIFDISGLIFAAIEFLLCLLALLGAVMMMLGNPLLAMLFPMQTIKNTALNDPIPGFAEGQDTGVPDVKCVTDNAFAVICKALKLVGLIPQLAMIVTIKDVLNALLALLACVQVKINSLTDALRLVPADTGDPLIDFELGCARDAIGDSMVHAVGPLVNILPMIQGVMKLAEPVQKGLPKSITNLIRTAMELGLIPFPATTAGDRAKEDFLLLLTTLEQGLAIDIPDFSNISSISEKMDELREKMQPLVGAVAGVQQLLEKLENC